MNTKRISQTGIVCLAALCLQLALPPSFFAQAWVPEKGSGVVSSTYSNFYVRNHVVNSGIKRTDLGRIRTNVILTSIDYGITDKLALIADLAYIASKWIGNPPGHGPNDTGSYHPTFQDAHLEVRYNAIRKSLVVTPFVGVIIPTHHYETRGHSAVGRGFHELQLGVNVGRQLGRLLPNGYVQARYFYAILARFDNVKLNRSNGDCEVGWFATKSLSVRFITTMQKTHGGLITPLEHDLDAHEFEFHDAITRLNLIDLGGGVSFAVNRSFGIHAAYLANVYARNAHAAGGFLAGFSWSFSRGLGLTSPSGSASPRDLPTLVQASR